MSCSASWWICGEQQTRSKNKWSYLTDMSKFKRPFFKLGLWRVKAHVAPDGGYVVN